MIKHVLYVTIATMCLCSPESDVRADHLVSAVFISKTDLSRPSEIYDDNGKKIDSKGCNKDFDSALFVTVALISGNTTSLLAQVINVEANVGYEPGSEHRVDLVVKDSAVTEDQCKSFKFKFGIKAVGNDYWRLSKATVVLTFDTGHTISKSVTCPTPPGANPTLGDSNKDIFIQSCASQLVEKGFFPE
jgi:hypothetical protein